MINSNLIILLMLQYSPYNKTYRYLLYQNQAYHIKNKRNASPEVRTNLRHSMSRISPVKDPQNNFQAYIYRSTRSQSSHRTNKKANLFLTDNQIHNVIIDKPIMQIHKNESYDKFQLARIEESNNSLVDRMIGTKCTVIRKSKALDQYQRHLKYSQIRARYNQNRQRKDSFSLGNKSMLCPTLSEFLKSRLGNSFLKNLSVNPQKRSLSHQKDKRVKNS